MTSSPSNNQRDPLSTPNHFSDSPGGAGINSTNQQQQDTPSSIGTPIRERLRNFLNGGSISLSDSPHTPPTPPRSQLTKQTSKASSIGTPSNHSSLVTALTASASNSNQSPFPVQRKSLMDIHHKKNITLFEYLGGVNYITRSLNSCLMKGIDVHDGLFRARSKWFGINKLTVADNQVMHLMRSVVSADAWVNKCKKYLNKQVFECEVVRNGTRQVVSSEDLVVGDVVYLKKGRKVPADGIYIDGARLEIDEGLVFHTASTQAVNRKSHSGDPFLFSLTEVVKGSGRMIVCCVGEWSTLAYYPYTLQFSIVFNNLSRAQKLIQEHQFSVNAPMGREGFMLVHWVAKYGSVPQLQFLLRNRVDLKARTRLDLSTPLDLAILYNNALIPVLLSNDNPYFLKSNPNLKDVYGRTCLFTAVRYADEEILRLLVSNNGKLTVVDHYGWTLLHYAVLYNTTNLEYLFSTQVFSRLLDHRDHDGNTALMYACWMGNVEVVRQLIEQGASVNIVNVAGRSALHYLVMGDTNPKFIYHGPKRYVVFKCGSRRIPRPKVKKGATLHEESLSNKCTTFHLLTILDILLENGIDVNQTDIGGLAPIHYCLMASQMEKDSGSFMRNLLSEEIRHPVEQSMGHPASNNQGEKSLLDFGSSPSNASHSTDDLHSEDDPDKKKLLMEFFGHVFKSLIEHGAVLDVEVDVSDAPVVVLTHQQQHGGKARTEMTPKSPIAR